MTWAGSKRRENVIGSCCRKAEPGRGLHHARLVGDLWNCSFKNKLINYKNKYRSLFLIPSAGLRTGSEISISSLRLYIKIQILFS